MKLENNQDITYIFSGATWQLFLIKINPQYKGYLHLFKTF